jgi:DNA-binding XRE family transcriptional regulator
MGTYKPNKFAIARARAGYTRAQIAAQAGTSVKTIGRIERGETRPHLLLAVRLTDLLGLELSDLLEDAS